MTIPLLCSLKTDRNSPVVEKLPLVLIVSWREAWLAFGVRVDEDGHKPRFYFPRGDVKMEKLERTKTVTHCPFKGSARYYSLHCAGKTLPDAVWSYEQPYDEHVGLAGRLAFYDDKYNDISVAPPA